MDAQGRLTFLGWTASIGLGCTLDALWRDRAERKYSLASKLALLPAWPFWAPHHFYRVGRIGPRRRVASTLLLPIAALFWLYAGWIVANLISIKNAIAAAERHEQRREFAQAYLEVENVGHAVTAIDVLPFHVKSVDAMLVAWSRVHAGLWLEVKSAQTNALWSQKMFPESRAAAREAVRYAADRLGRQDEDYARALALLGAVRRQEGDLVEAEALNKEVCAVIEKIYGPTHPKTLKAALSMARFYKDQRRYDEALTWYRRVRPATGIDASPKPGDPAIGQKLDALDASIAAANAAK